MGQHFSIYFLTIYLVHPYTALILIQKCAKTGSVFGALISDESKNAAIYFSRTSPCPYGVFFNNTTLSWKDGTKWLWIILDKRFVFRKYILRIRVKVAGACKFLTLFLKILLFLFTIKHSHVKPALSLL